jgi:hypothetical protein
MKRPNFADVLKVGNFSPLCLKGPLPIRRVQIPTYIFKLPHGLGSGFPSNATLF